MRKHVKKAALIAAATISILLGIAGLFLPLLQGWLFLAIGIILLSIVVPSVREWRSRHTVRFPKLHKKIEELEEWVRRSLGE